MTDIGRTSVSSSLASTQAIALILHLLDEGDTMNLPPEDRS